MRVSVRSERDATEVDSYAVEVMRTDFVDGSAIDRRATLEILMAPANSALALGREYLVLLDQPGRVSGAMVALPVVSGRIAAPDELTLNGMPSTKP